jgi:hypothetical protein
MTSLFFVGRAVRTSVCSLDDGGPEARLRSASRISVEDALQSVATSYRKQTRELRGSFQPTTSFSLSRPCAREARARRVAQTRESGQLRCDALSSPPAIRPAWLKEGSCSPRHGSRNRHVVLEVTPTPASSAEKPESFAARVAF